MFARKNKCFFVAMRKNRGIIERMKHETIALPVHYEGTLTRTGNPPFLKTYILDNFDFDANRLRPLVLICPGGGYEHLSPREAEAVAIQMNARGFHAAVLFYSLAPMEFPAALCDLAEAVHFVRSMAAAWNVDGEKIIVAGFSAGAHLSASLGVYWNGLPAGGASSEDKTPLIKKYLPYKNTDIKPNALLLCYPVITAGEWAHRSSIQKVLGEKKGAHTEWVSLENLVSKDVPPVFMWHTSEDCTVPAQNSLLFALALQKEKIPVEYHLFQRGVHGLSLASAETANTGGREIQMECAVWIDLFATWANLLFEKS